MSFLKSPSPIQRNNPMLWYHLWGPCQGLATLNLRHPSHLRPIPRQDSSCSPIPTQGGDTKSFFLLSSNHLPWLQPFCIMVFPDIVVITRVHSTNQGRLAGVFFPPWFMDTNAFFPIYSRAQPLILSPKRRVVNYLHVPNSQFKSHSEYRKILRILILNQKKTLNYLPANNNPPDPPTHRTVWG